MPLTARIGADFRDFERALQSVELKLKGFGGSVSGLQRDLSRAVEGFQGTKIFKEAEIAAEGIKRVGGASKLTQAEQARVNATVTEAIAKYRALGQDAPPHLVALEQATRRLPAANESAFGSFKTLVASWVTAQLTIAGLQRAFRTITQFIGSSVTAYAEQEAATKKLTQALESQQLATPKTIRAYAEMAAQFQRTTVFGDELVLEMQALLTQIGGVMPTQMQRALKASTDLAAGLGIDLRTATLLVGKAFAGETGTLARYGIVIDQARFKTEGISVVLDALGEKFGGQAQAQIETYAGRITQMSNAWGDFKEVIGEVITQNPATVAALTLLRSTVDGLNVSTQSGEEAWVKFSRLLFGSGSTYIAIAADAALDLARQLEGLKRAAQDSESPLQKMARAMAETGTPVAEAVRQVEAFKAGLLAAIKAEEEATKVAEAHAKAVASLVNQLTGRNTAEEVRRLADALRAIRAEGKDTPETLTRVAAAAWDLRLKGAQLPPVLQAVVDEFARLQARALPLLATLPAVADEAAAIRNIMAGLDADGLLPVSRSFAGFITQAPSVRQSFRGLGVEVSSLGDAFKSLLGGDFGAAFSSFGNFFKSGAKSIATGFLEGIGGMITGGISSLIGKGLSALGNLFGFGKSEGRKQLEAANADIQKLQQSLIGTHGSLEALERQANIVGISFKDAWGHQNVKGLEAFKALVADFDKQQAHLQQALDKYGLTWEDLGDKAKQLKLNEWATSVLDDFNILITAGADFTLVLDKMAPEFSKIIQASMRTGTEVPAAMRPILEQLIELGLLVDENGEKITSLEGISFGETLTQGIDRIVDKLNELLRGLGILPAEAAQSFGAAGREARAFYDEFGGRGGGAGDVDLAHYGGLVTHAGIQRLHQGAARVLPFRRMHAGGLAADEVPAILQIGERVLNRREAAAYDAGARSGSRGMVIRIPVYLDGRQIAEATVPHIPGVLSRRGIA